MDTQYYTRLDDVITVFRNVEAYLRTMSWLIDVPYYKMVPIRNLDQQ